ncbi:MAG: hypothetical protein Kow0069_37000 [Promethearchaeota archaeon]
MACLVALSGTVASSPARRAIAAPYHERVTVLVFSWAEKTPYLTSLSLKNEVVGDFVTDFYNVTVTTAETYRSEKDQLNFAGYDVLVFDSFLPEDVAEVRSLKAWMNGTLGNVGVLFFGGYYPQEALEEFSDVLPVDIVAHRGALNSTLAGIFANTTGLPGDSFNLYLNFSYNNIREYNNRTNQVELEVSDEAVRQRTIFRSPRIAWGSCPLIKERIQTVGAKDGSLVIVQVPSTREPIVVEWNVSSSPRLGTQVMYVSAGTINPPGDDEWNKPFYLWPYWNYWMYVTLFHLKADFSDEDILTYAQWPYSPIPHELEAGLWMGFVAFLWVFNFVLFFTLGRKGKKRRDAAEAAAKVSTAEATGQQVSAATAPAGESDWVSIDGSPEGDGNGDGEEVNE